MTAINPLLERGSLGVIASYLSDTRNLEETSRSVRDALTQYPSTISQVYARSISLLEEKLPAMAAQIPEPFSDKRKIQYFYEVLIPNFQQRIRGVKKWEVLHRFVHQEDMSSDIKEVNRIRQELKRLRSFNRDHPQEILGEALGEWLQLMILVGPGLLILFYYSLDFSAQCLALSRSAFTSPARRDIYCKDAEFFEYLILRPVQIFYLSPLPFRLSIGLVRSAWVYGRVGAEAYCRSVRDGVLAFPGDVLAGARVVGNYVRSFFR